MAEYVTALALAEAEPNEVTIRRVCDAMTQLKAEHYACLLRSVERAKKAREGKTT